MPTEEDVRNALKTVEDPELHMDIVTLELIYEIKVENGNAYVRMTLTTPACPYGPALLEEVKRKVTELEGIKDVQIELTFVPPWQPSEDLRSMFGV